jgi:hypothetical protein
MAGGVPFWLRLSATSSGVVYSRNITPDPETGIGNWTEDEIVEVLRSGKRKDGSSLLLFPPHSFYKNMAEEDARSLAVYLRSLKPMRNVVAPRSLPFPTAPTTGVTSLEHAPRGRSIERARYLVSAIVGCRECHSHNVNGSLAEFTGGDPDDPVLGMFRLGPDLPLRQNERGLATFPYPGYAVLFGSNLTRFGRGGDLARTSEKLIVRAIREGIGVEPDRYGRADPLEHVMMWQFYRRMRDDDVSSLAKLLKSLTYVKHDTPDLQFFGDDWRAAFEYVFKQAPGPSDLQLFGKRQTP